MHPLFSKFAITLAAFAPSAQAVAVRCGNDEDDDLIPSAPRGRTRADGIASEIERAILARELAVGELIGSEETLAERFGASRPVVREAFRILELSGLATTRRGPGGGLIVVAPNPDPVVAAAERFLVYVGVKPLQVAEARMAIELACLDTLLEGINEDKIARLREYIEREGEPAHHELAEERDRFETFHTLLAELSENKAFALFVPVLARLSTGATDPETHHLHDLGAEIHGAHRAIAEAIVLGDVAVARHRMRKHLEALASAYTDEAHLRDDDSRA